MTAIQGRRPVSLTHRVVYSRAADCWARMILAGLTFRLEGGRTPADTDAEGVPA